MAETSARHINLTTPAYDHIVHVLEKMRVCGAYSMIMELTQALGTYRHTLVHETENLQLDADTLVYAQSIGCDVVGCDKLDQEALLSLRPTVVILHSTTAPHLRTLCWAASVPCLYYAYGTYDRDAIADAVVTCTPARIGRHNEVLEIPMPAYVVPPLVNTRALRRVAGGDRPFTVALLNSGSTEKYPYALASYMLEQLPPSIGILLTTPPEKHPALEAAIAEERRQRRRRLSLCPPHPSGSVQYTVLADVFLHGTQHGYYEPYGRMVVEAMGMGKPIVTEARGYPGTALITHGRNGLVYSEYEQAKNYILKLHNDKKLCMNLGANAMLSASWEDSAAHIGEFKRILRSIGA